MFHTITYLQISPDFLFTDAFHRPLSRSIALDGGVNVGVHVVVDAGNIPFQF